MLHPLRVDERVIGRDMQVKRRIARVCMMESKVSVGPLAN